MSNKKINIVSCGVLNLDAKEGSLFKRTLICHTGTFKGVYGPVEITEQRLSRIAEKHNKARAKPANQYDYPPILTDHERKVDNVKGRVLTDLSVEDWQNPETNVVEKGLYGPLRVDNADAQLKVADGTYSQVSMSFDEDDDELYEVSFVAVEAARRSQVLSQGENQMSVELQAQLKQANDKHVALKAQVMDSITVRKAITLSATENLTATQAELVSIASSLELGLKASKTALLQAQFKGLIRTGQLKKAEFDKIEFVKLSAMKSDDLKILMDSYKSRPVSPHIQQFGQEGAQPMSGNLSASQMREAVKLQKSGKGEKRLAADDAPKPKKDDEGKDKKASEYSDSDGDMDDFEGALQKMGEIEPIVSRAKEFLGKMSESLKKLGDQNEKDKEVA